MKSIILSGGGSKGAHQCGVIKYLLGDLKINYDAFFGVSVGAINSAYLAQFKTGEEETAATTMWDMWSKIDQDSIYKPWFLFGKLASLWRMGFFDSSPMRDLIYGSISLDKIRHSGKRVSVGVVSASSGKYKTFTEKSNDFLDAVIGSASFPGAFEPVQIQDELYIDGGIKSISPIAEAISMGSTEITIVMTSPEQRIKKFMQHPSIGDIFIRAFDLSTDKILSNDIEKVFMYNKMAEAGIKDKKYIKLNIIRPKNNLIEDMLDFTPSKIKQMMDIGYKDAKSQYNPE
jgi:NTE family protein